MLNWIQASVRADRQLAHAHVRPFSDRRSADRLKYLASIESGAGVFVNDVGPETSADMLRRALAGAGGGSWTVDERS
ncbi:MAG TPA: hypothetical protein VF902_07785 [Coriobacteriia bacterium]